MAQQMPTCIDRELAGPPFLYKRRAPLPRDIHGARNGWMPRLQDIQGPPEFPQLEVQLDPEFVPRLPAFSPT